MRVPSLVLVATLVAAHAQADTPKAPAKPAAPDLTLRWTEGESSLDMSLTVVDISVTGDSVHYQRRHLGRGPFVSADVELRGRIKDPRKLASAIAALDKLPPRKMPEAQQDTSFYTESCLTRGKVTRCAYRHETDPKSPELEALATIRTAMTEGLKLGPLDL